MFCGSRVYLPPPPPPFRPRGSGLQCSLRHCPSWGSLSKCRVLSLPVNVTSHDVEGEGAARDRGRACLVPPHQAWAGRRNPAHDTTAFSGPPRHPYLF